jgi:hypothetical protein
MNVLINITVVFIMSLLNGFCYCWSGIEMKTSTKNNIQIVFHSLNEDAGEKLFQSYNYQKIILLSGFPELSLEYSVGVSKQNQDLMPELFDFNIFKKKFPMNRNILRIERKDQTSSQGGHNFVLFETLGINSGMFSRKRPDNIKTSGYEFRMKGFFMMLDDCSNDSVINFISDHIDIRFFRSEFSANNFAKVELKGINFVFSGFNLY